MQFTRPGMSESDIEAYFQYTCALSYDAGDGMGKSGCERPAYVPVVASG
jgi:intermediate cleaving peptidase 55